MAATTARPVASSVALCLVPQVMNRRPLALRRLSGISSHVEGPIAPRVEEMRGGGASEVRISGGLPLTSGTVEEMRGGGAF